ncbi:MAG TPA: 50S ribosomal protein L21 [bacterium]|nr:50S ribosomal protein L21 [bacterium]
MYAVIKTGGKQYRVSPGEVVKIEKLAAAVGEPVVFSEVLMVGDGAELKVGAPLVDNAKVKGTVQAQKRDKKIVVYTYKKRKGYHKKSGHRQDITLVRIDEVVED